MQTHFLVVDEIRFVSQQRMLKLKSLPACVYVYMCACTCVYVILSFQCRLSSVAMEEPRGLAAVCVKQIFMVSFITYLWLII